MLRTNDSHAVESPGLLAALSIFRRRWAIVMLGTFTGSALAALYCWTTPTIYQSAAQIQLVHQGGALLSPNGDSRDLGSFEEAALANHMMILESERVVEAALERDDLKNLESIQQALDTDQDEVEYIIENLRVHRGGEGEGRLAHVITVRMRHTSAKDCAAILRSVIASYNEYVATDMSAHYEDASLKLKTRERQLREEREAKYSQYREFRENSPSLMRKDGALVNMHHERVERLGALLDDIRMRKVELRSRLQSVKDILADSPADAVGFDRLTLLRDLALRSQSPDDTSLPSGRAEINESTKAEFNQLLEMKLREKDLLLRYGRRHHLVVRTQQGIAETERFLKEKREDMERAFVQLLLNDLRDLERREAEYAKQYREEEEAALKLVQAELDDENFRFELKNLDVSHANALARLSEADLTSDYGEFSSQTLATVKLGEPVSPNRVLVMVLGVAVGLFCGLGSAVVVDFLVVSGTSERIEQPIPQSAPAAKPQPVRNMPVPA